MLLFECLHNQFCVILYVILIILFGCGCGCLGGGGGWLIGISPRVSKWLETAPSGTENIIFHTH